MVNYAKSIVYKICCKDPSITDEYVGSTVNFTRRKSQHKACCHNENTREFNFKVYQTIRENGGWLNWSMVELERYCATDRKDLNARERFWFEELGATLNLQIPNRSKAEYGTKYGQENKEKIAEQKAKYRQKNKAKIAEYNSEYNQKNKEKIAEYRKNNKEKIAERCTKKIQCECGCVITKRCLPRHLKTTKHKKLMEEK